jgi:hypothetical protein
MTDPTNRIEETALWRRWRAAVAEAAGAATPAPDPLLLAAYAEHRLGETAVEEVEAWLALHPEVMADVLEARHSNVDRRAGQASSLALARAMVLVPAEDPRVVPFRRAVRPLPAWRDGAVRAALAASILVVSLVGFALGTDAYTSLLNGNPSAPAISQDLFDPPTGIFSSFGEETST